MARGDDCSHRFMRPETTLVVEQVGRSPESRRADRIGVENRPRKDCSHRPRKPGKDYLDIANVMSYRDINLQPSVVKWFDAVVLRAKVAGCIENALLLRISRAGGY